MDSMSSSPIAPRATSFGASLDEQAKQTGKRDSYGVAIDDSSSVASTSMSWTGNRNNCHVCKTPESLPTKPLLRCIKCKKKWHTFCHNPKILNPEPEWQCNRCTGKINEKMNSHSSTRLTQESPTFNSGPSKQEYRKVTVRLTCEIANCNNSQVSTNTKGLCKLHEVDERHKNAQAQKQTATFKPAPVSKSIDKLKLYPLKKDEETRAILAEGKDKKRKREAPMRGGNGTQSHDVGHEARQKIGLPRKPSRSKITSQMSPRTQGFAPEQEDGSAITERPLQSRQRSSGRSIDDILGLASRKNARLEEAQRRILQESEEAQPTTSPEYEPPPANVAIPKIADTDDNLSPGSQITQEFRAMVESPADEPCPTSADLSLFISQLNPSNSLRLRDLVEGPADDVSCSGSEVPAVAGLEDQSMDDVESSDYLAAEEITLSPDAYLSRSLPVSPVLSSKSSSKPPDEDILLQEATSSFLHDTSLLPESLEAKRRQKAAIYDSTTLDLFLQKQFDLGSKFQPSPEELSRTQVWGHIDPREKWPETYSDEWVEAKKAEIEARGGRKANFGKLLTAQVRKERADNGWHIHQNKEYTPDEKSAESARAMEELFGVKGIDDLIPAVRDGKLVMLEKPFDENGKRRRKPKVYPVDH